MAPKVHQHLLAFLPAALSTAITTTSTTHHQHRPSSGSSRRTSAARNPSQCPARPSSATVGTPHRLARYRRRRRRTATLAMGRTYHKILATRQASKGTHLAPRNTEPHPSTTPQEPPCAAATILCPGRTLPSGVSKKPSFRDLSGRPGLDLGTRKQSSASQEHATNPRSPGQARLGAASICSPDRAGHGQNDD
ncbi:uncharacterized protein PSFLO_01069 [Pseudozyma flocculosa]|uniref:Uncharacterized protein n=1 Tax=Pseudozyma flocculosa TaxID=84751 RepID=A0A5C3ETK1_9BASI|nr:uncharacterized protein PSFLO_01069 [Pseudozyma flocculosa]